MKYCNKVNHQVCYHQKAVKDNTLPVLQHTKPPAAKEVVKSYEGMRKERLKERLKLREERNVN